MLSKQLDEEIKNKSNDLEKFFIKNGTVSVREYFDELKCEVDLATEQQIELIRKNNERLMKEIDLYEKECLQKIENQQKFDNSLQKEYENFNNESRKDLSEHEIVEKLEEIKGKFTEQLNTIKSNTFDDQEWKFSKSLIDTSDGIIGSINQYNKKRINGELVKSMDRINGFVSTLDMLHNGNFITVWGENSETIKILNHNDAKLVRKLSGDVNQEICALTVLQNGFICSGFYNGIIEIWNPESGELIKKIICHGRSPLSFLNVLDNGILCSGCDSGNIELWIPLSGELIGTITGHGSPALGITTLMNGNFFSWYEDDINKIWNPLDYKLIKSFTGRSVYSLKALESGDLCTGDIYGTIEIWNPESGKVIHRLNGHASKVTSLAILANGDLCSGDNVGTIRIWDSISYELIGTLKGHSGRVSALMIDPNGNLNSGSWDGSIKIWR